MLNAIKAAHPGIGAKIDLTVCNPDRLCKIPGTLAAKGDHTTERPHRISELTDVPETLEIVTREQLEALAGAFPSSSPQPAAYDAAIEAHVTAVDRPLRVEVIAGQLDPDKPGFDLKGYLVKHGLCRDDVEPKVWDKADGKGLLYELVRCPWDEHAKSNKAYAIQFENGNLAAGCHSDDCKKLGASWAKLREVMEPGWRTKAAEKPAALTLEQACEQAGGSVASNGDCNFDGEATEALRLLGLEFSTPAKLADKPQKLRRKNGRLYVLIRGSAAEKSWNIPGWSYESSNWEHCVKGWHEPKPSDDADDKASLVDTYSFAFSGDELFHAPDREPFAACGGQTWPIKSETYKLLLRNRIYTQRKMTISETALKVIIDTLASCALFSGEERKVYLRTATFDGKCFVDLANERNEVVEITADGWNIITAPPVNFVRKDGMLPLPTPTRGGNVNQLRQFLNVTEEDFKLILIWLVSALGEGPYLILLLTGEKGTGKSNAIEMLRALVDPSSVDLADEPESMRDLMIYAKNSYVVAFDNLTEIPKRLSNVLCMIAKNGGKRIRRGYTDDSEMLFSARRPIALGGIKDYATRPDLLDRSLCIDLQKIKSRRDEKQLFADFYAARPAIFGALLTGLVHGIRGLAAIKGKQLDLPRMRDAIEWAIAAERGLGFKEGEFAKAVWANYDTTTESAIDGSPVAGAVLKLMADRTEWQGKAGELLAELNRVAGDSIRGAEGRPLLAHKLSQTLKEVAPDLRRRGIEVEISTARPRVITLTSAKAPKPISGGRLYDHVQTLKGQLVALDYAPEQALEMAIAATAAAYPHRTVVDGMPVWAKEPLSDEDKAKLHEHMPGAIAEIRERVQELIAAAVAYAEE